jgi:sulfatase maturation enzyme AslB (radical SAM superfamily)
MSENVGYQSLDLLFSAPNRDLELVFFGGEPLMRWDLVRDLCDTAVERAKQEGRTIAVQITTNAWALTEEYINDMLRWNTFVQLSLDGDPETQNSQRRPYLEKGDSYTRGPASNIDKFHEAGVDYGVIMVVAPKRVERMAANFFHLMDLGVRQIQLNYAIGTSWDLEACEHYADAWATIAERLEAHWAAGGTLDVVNLRERVASVRNNLHMTVDFDGTIYGGNNFLFQKTNREEFALGHLDDRRAWHRYMVDGRSDADVFNNWKRPASADEAFRVGSVHASFVRHMQARHPERLGGRQQRSY